VDCGSQLPLSGASLAGVGGREMFLSCFGIRPECGGIFSKGTRGDFDGSRAASEKRQQAAAVQGAAHESP